MKHFNQMGGLLQTKAVGRVQRKRIKGYKLPPNTVSVTRPGKWGNPFKVGMTIKAVGKPNRELKTVEDVMDAYKWWLKECNDGMEISRLAKKELRGKNLACFCPILDKRGNYVVCHADILLQIANY